MTSSLQLFAFLQCQTIVYIQYCMCYNCACICYMLNSMHAWAGYLVKDRRRPREIQSPLDGDGHDQNIRPNTQIKLGYWDFHIQISLVFELITISIAGKGIVFYFFLVRSVWPIMQCNWGGGEQHTRWHSVGVY